LPHEHVRPAHAHGVRTHAHLTGAGFGQGELGEFQRLWTPVTADDDGFHR
jgi:hypothetical protein